MKSIIQNRTFCLFWAVIVPLLFLISGCAVLKFKDTSSTSKVSSETSKSVNTGPAPLYYDFGDILIPGELKVDKKESFVYNTSDISAGVLVLNGRVDMNSLISFFETNMANDNWRIVSSFKSAHTLLLFQKENRRCVISIYETSLNTHAKVWVAPTFSEIHTGLIK